MLALGARRWEPPLTWFGGIKSEGDGRIDLKRSGLMPILIAARALSIRHGVHKRPTPDRLRDVAAKGAASADEVEDIIESHRGMLRAILLQQLTDARQGTPLTAKVVVKSKVFGRSGLRGLIDSAASASRLVNEGMI
jgi:DNA polymerase-3 subunit epsilon/CBS domain-containing protein